MQVCLKSLTSEFSCQELLQAMYKVKTYLKENCKLNRSYLEGK